MEKTDFEDKILYGIRLAQKKLFEEKALHDDVIVLADKEGRPYTMKAADYLAQHKEFFDAIK